MPNPASPQEQAVLDAYLRSVGIKYPDRGTIDLALDTLHILTEPDALPALLAYIETVAPGRHCLLCDRPDREGGHPDCAERVRSGQVEWDETVGRWVERRDPHESDPAVADGASPDACPVCNDPECSSDAHVKQFGGCDHPADVDVDDHRVCVVCGAVLP